MLVDRVVFNAMTRAGRCEDRSFPLKWIHSDRRDLHLAIVEAFQELLHHRRNG